MRIEEFAKTALDGVAGGRLVGLQNLAERSLAPCPAAPSCALSEPGDGHKLLNLLTLGEF